MVCGWVSPPGNLGSEPMTPGLPLKTVRASANVALIESQNKKATFLREVIRALKLTGVQVIAVVKATNVMIDLPS